MNKARRTPRREAVEGDHVGISMAKSYYRYARDNQWETIDVVMFTYEVMRDITTKPDLSIHKSFGVDRDRLLALVTYALATEMVYMCTHRAGPYDPGAGFTFRIMLGRLASSLSTAPPIPIDYNTRLYYELIIEEAEEKLRSIHYWDGLEGLIAYVS